MAANIGKNDPIVPAPRTEARAVVPQAEARQKAEEAPSASRDEAAALDVSRQTGRSSQLVDLNDVASSLSIADEALSKIGDLRDRQLDIAKEAEGSDDPARREELNAEFQAIEAEIGSVVENATFNGENALVDRAISVSANLFAIEDQLEVRGVERAAAPLEASPRSPDDARAASKGVREKIEEIASAREGVEAASRRANRILEDASRQGGEARPTSEGASELVNRLAGDLTSRPASERPTREIVSSVTNNLSPERVNELLRI